MKVKTMTCTKKFCLGQMGCFGPKNGANLHNSESTLRFFYKNFAE